MTIDKTLLSNRDKQNVGVTFKIRSGDKIVCLVEKHRKLMRTSRTFLKIFHSNSYYENIMTFCSSLLSMFLEKKTTKTNKHL